MPVKIKIETAKAENIYPKSKITYLVKKTSDGERIHGGDKINKQNKRKKAWISKQDTM